MIAQEIQPLLRVFVAGKPCSVNKMYSTGRGRNHAGRRRSEECLAWQAYVGWTCKKSRLTRDLAARGKFTVEMEFYQLRANSDADNFIKATLDALAGALGINDKQITTVIAKKMPWVKGRTQGVMLTVWEASPDA